MISVHRRDKSFARSKINSPNWSNRKDRHAPMRRELKEGQKAEYR